MVVLSYNAAKKSILFLAIYMVSLSLLFKGIAIVTDFSITMISSNMDSLLNFQDFKFTFPDINFNLENLSFDGIKVFVVDGIKSFIDNLVNLTIGVINITAGIAATSYLYDKPYLLLRYL